MTTFRMTMAFFIIVIYSFVSGRDIENEEKAQKYSYSEQSSCQVCNEVQ